MDFRSTPCVFLGYSTTHHGYRCFDPLTDRLYIARHVRFDESSFPFHQKNKHAPPPTTSSPYVSSYPITPPTSAEPEPQPSTPTSHSAPTVETHPATPSPSGSPSVSSPSSSDSPTDSSPSSQPPTETTSTSSTQPTPPSQPPPVRTRPANLRQNPKATTRFNPSAYHTKCSSDEEPATFAIANNDPTWRRAMTAEHDALIRNGTWTLVPRPPRTNIVDCKWVYKIKRNQDGNITRNKAHLVAKGFRQQSGVYYQETFSPVIKAATIRVVLSLVVHHK